jgi:hypothetical protein
MSLAGSGSDFARRLRDEQGHRARSAEREVERRREADVAETAGGGWSGWKRGGRVAWDGACQWKLESLRLRKPSLEKQIGKESL